MSKINVLYDLIYKTLKDALYKTLLIPDAVMNKEYNEIKNAYVEKVVQETTPEVEGYQTELNLSDVSEFVKEDETKSVIINKELKDLVLYPIGAAHGTYIIAENDEGVYLIDQHAAQERINYEKYMKALKEEKTASTAMLIPINVELSSSEFLELKNHLEVLINLGFVVEEFGINTYSIKEHPTWLLHGYEEESIRKIIDLIISNKGNFDRVKFNESLAITLACKMSIKANMHISIEAMEELLNALVKCDNPYNCPHGRPTIIKFTIYDLERMFKRVMN